MSEKDEKPQGDPFAQMVQFYDDWTKNWSGAMSDSVSSKSFADSMAQQLEGNLSAMGLMRRQVSELMEQSLQQMNLPTRKDVLGLAGRMTNLEMRLDDMEAKLDEVLDLLKNK
jgi:polyhydroxyalkanoate synthesis regulator phasin